MVGKVTPYDCWGVGVVSHKIRDWRLTRREVRVRENPVTTNPVSGLPTTGFEGDVRWATGSTYLQWSVWIRESMLPMRGDLGLGRGWGGFGVR